MVGDVYMKKILAVFLSLATIFISACAETDKTMMIKPAEFTEETKSILEVTDGETLFFDYNVDETIKSVEANYWSYIENEWIEHGSSQLDIGELNGKIGIKMTENEYYYYQIGENVSSHSFKVELDLSFTKSRQQMWSELYENTEINPNEEVVLFAKIGNNSESIHLTNDFRESDCTEGFAVTVTFLEE